MDQICLLKDKFQILLLHKTLLQMHFHVKKYLLFWDLQSLHFNLRSVLLANYQKGHHLVLNTTDQRLLMPLWTYKINLKTWCLPQRKTVKQTFSSRNWLQKSRNVICFKNSWVIFTHFGTNILIRCALKAQSQRTIFLIM